MTRGDAKPTAKLVEETLRYDSPVQLTMRISTRATDLAGIAIPEGSAHRRAHRVGGIHRWTP
ncbi:MAG: hypothetical protein JRJ58_22600 [Deltaproteobacteria bacterium]|nr:hypothetical protein [Deltaproteobacteria bacterium]